MIILECGGKNLVLLMSNIHIISSIGKYHTLMHNLKNNSTWSYVAYINILVCSKCINTYLKWSLNID